MSLPPAVPVRLTLPARPEWDVTSETPVVGLGPFEPVCEGRSDPYAEAVHGVKRGERHVDDFADQLSALVSEAVGITDYVATVPAHDGADQPQLETLAEALPPEAAVPIRRREAVHPTKDIEGEEDRWANVAGTVEVPADLTGATVVLVDDVLASGASLATAAAALRGAGAAAVHGAVLGVRIPSRHPVVPIPSAVRRTN